MSEAIPGAKLVALRPGGHMALIERHTQFADAVRSLEG
jgi:pimeloyl-ACP methyl ester carboxylesterase